MRLPLEFRFDVAAVFISQDPATGDVVLSRKPSPGATPFELQISLTPPFQPTGL